MAVVRCRMAAQRPPGNAPPPPETLDDSELIDIDETAPPQRSPLKGVLPFGAGGPRPPTPPPPPAPPPAPRFGEETAPAERSPLAAALPFRHAKPGASTVAIPMPTPEDLRRLAGGPPQQPVTPGLKGPLSAADRARMEQAKTVAFAAMPPGFGDPGYSQTTPAAHSASPAATSPSPHQQSPLQAPSHASPVPAGGGPVAARSTGHFGLSIEQYAALCAEVAILPDAAEATFAKYGLAARKERLTADAAWQDRLRADNALMQRWQSLYLYYHEYYARTLKR